MKRFLLVLIMLLIPAQVFASTVTLYHKERPVYLEVKDVSAEVYRLEKVFPPLQKVNYEWRIWDGVRWAGDFILGVTLPVDKTVYLYSPPWTYIGNSSVQYYTYALVDHEMGHVVRCEFISEKELADYYAIRTKGVNVDTTYYANKPEELFAEDFKSLWGVPSWRKSWIPKPTEVDRQWILSHLGGDS